MSRKNSITSILIICLFSMIVISCNLFKDSETEELRKEIADMKKEKEKENNSNTENSEDTKDTKDTEKTDTKSKEKPKEKTKPKPTLPINQNEVSDLIDDWENAQNTNSYNNYKSLYATEFTGIKRTSGGKVSHMNYSQWLNNRRKMLGNIKSVVTSNRNITIVGNTATVEFTQDFKSNNYQDTGQKILKIQMYADGAKIIYEEMKDLI